MDPAVTLIELYHERWEEELTIDELKTHQRERPVLRSQTAIGVLQEIHGLLLGHYAVRVLMHQAARTEGNRPATDFLHRHFEDLAMPIARVPEKSLRPAEVVQGPARRNRRRDSS